jgi:hypothetical protein
MLLSVFPDFEDSACGPVRLTLSPQNNAIQ